MKRYIVLTAIAIVSLSVLASQAKSQTASTNRGYTPTSYTDYYNQQVSSYRTLVNPRRYTVDRYFYHNPSLSPYLNLARRTGPAVNNYYRYVKPELNRREAAAYQSSQPPLRRSSLGTGAATHWQGNDWTLHTR